MHFDPAPSTQDSSFIQDRLGNEILLDRELEAGPEPDAEDPAPRRREGLPPGFRMRHARHYVEQLTGDGPLRTVREIALGDIEAPPTDDLDVQDLERSVRQLGVLEPLLVSQHGGSYRLIAGRHRLRAARNAGLGTVPCLVHDVDEEMLETMQHAVMQRAAVPAPPPPDVVEPAREVPLPPAFADVSQGLAFVSALLPAIGAAGEDRFRWNLLTEIAAVELTRARTLAAAVSVAGVPDLVREEASGQQLIEEALAGLATEARLRGLRIHTALPAEEYTVALDRRLAGLALTGLLQGMFLLIPGPGSLRVSMAGTQVRPALIVTISQAETALPMDALPRFYDADWAEHPAGASGALLLSTARRVARLHGGRADVQLQPADGCTVTLVIPRPLTDAWRGNGIHGRGGNVA